MTRTVELPPRTRVILEDPFHSITSLHASRLPDARLGIHCERNREIYLIMPRGWGNIWVDAREIILAGYIPRDEFRRQSAFVPPDSRVFQYSRTHLKNLAVSVSSLRPPEELLAKAREWRPA
jgi:hypothetical protein